MTEIRVLGPVQVIGSDGEPVAIGGPRQRRLAAALALEPGLVVSDAALTEIIWPDGDAPDDPRNALQTYVSRLRSAGLVVERSGSGYTLSTESSELDARFFQQEVSTAERLGERGDADAAAVVLASALERWRGPAFGEFADDEWARAEATRLDELRVRTRERLAQLEVDRGRAADAISDVRALCAEHPLRDAPHRLLMLALHATGDQAAALRVFQEFRARLAEETGLEPSADMESLEHQIVTGEVESTRPEVPSRLGSYEVGELIGEGAFGAIYRATQPAVGREVAIKVVRPELANDPQFVRRFEVEAQTVARLEHPHIVPLYDYWRDPSGAYLVMRYLGGGSAEHRLVQHGAWTVEQVGRVVDEIGAALAVAHDAGVLHRDVKPANVLFDEAGNSYLADFGIATEVGDTTVADLRSAGSPLYVSPEQVRDGDASPASDIYSFGVLLYELLTGQAPFADSDSVQSLLDRKIRERVPSVADVRPDVPSAVDLVIHTATAPDPVQRFPSMAELVLAFRAATAGLADSAGSTAGGGSDERPRSAAAQTLIGLELEGVNPYKGLAAFDEADSGDFHGRAALADELVDRLGSSRFLVVTGPSGSGKSSVVRAGVLPRLRDTSAFVASIVPGAHPMDELETALLRVATEPTGALMEQLTADERGLGRAIKTLLPDDGAELVLVVDQFEELFTITPHDRRDAFLAALAAAVTDERSRLRVICTLRADFYDRPLQHPAVSELVRVNTVAVTPLSGEELDEAIARPAANVGVTVEPALVAEIVAQAAGQAAALPMLQYALTEMFERRIGGRMTMESYRDIGGLTGALANRADELYEEQDEAERAEVRRLFTRLVTPGEGTEDTRRRVLRSELSGVSAEVVDAYGAARLLTFDHDPASREPTVEVAHEALIREWPRLRSWLDDDRDGLRILRHLGQSADSWDESGRAPAELYRGGRLEAAEEWAAANGADMTPLEDRFLRASVDQRAAEDAAERQRLRRLRTLLAGTAVVAAIAVIAGVVALRQRSDAQDQREVAFENAAAAEQSAAEARAAEQTAQTERDAAETARTDAVDARSAAEISRMASDAAARASDNPQVALLLAAEAFRREPGPAALGALQQVFSTIGPFLGVIGAGHDYSAVGWLDGDRIAAVGSSGLAVYRVSTGERLLEVPVTIAQRKYDIGGDASPAPMPVAAFSPSRVVVATEDTACCLTFVDLDSGEVQTSAIEHEADIEALAMSPDGSVVASIEVTGRLRVFDTTTGELVWEVDAYPEETLLEFDLPADYDPAGFIVGFDFSGSRPSLRPLSLQFSPNGNMLVTQGNIVTRFWDARTGETSRPEWVNTVQADGSSQWTRFHAIDFDAAGEPVIAGQQMLATDTRQVEIESTGPWYGMPNLIDFHLVEGNEALVQFTANRLATVDILTGRITDLEFDASLPDPGRAALSPRGTRVAVPSADGVGLWSLAGDRLIAEGYPRRGARWGTIEQDGTRMTAMDAAYWFDPALDGEMTYVDLETGEYLPLPDDDEAYSYAIRANRLYAWSHDFRMHVFDRTTLERLGRLEQVGANSFDAFEPGGFSALGSMSVTVFPLDGGEATHTLEPTAVVSSLTYSDSLGRLAGAQSIEGGLNVWDTTTWELIEDGTGVDGFVRAARYSPDGRFLVTVDDGGAFALRDPETHVVVRSLLGSRVDVLDNDFWFSRDGRFMISGGFTSLTLWDLEAGVQVGGSFPNDPGFRVAGNDGLALMTADDDHLLVWNLDFASWPEIACQAAGRNMTLAEWEQFGPQGEEYGPTCPQWPSLG